MADFAYNQAKGKAVEWAARVLADDPANAIFTLELINTTATDATLKDLDDFGAIESDANTAEVTNTNYARKTFNQASSLTVTIDDTNDRTALDISDQTWTALGTGTITDAVMGYDSDSTGGTDANVKPISQHDFPITGDGSDVTATVADFYRAA